MGLCDLSVRLIIHNVLVPYINHTSGESDGRGEFNRKLYQL